jgi:hypothetical protein
MVGFGLSLAVSSIVPSAAPSGLDLVQRLRRLSLRLGLPLAERGLERRESIDVFPVRLSSGLASLLLWVDDQISSCSLESSDSMTWNELCCCEGESETTTVESGEVLGSLDRNFLMSPFVVASPLGFRSTVASLPEAPVAGLFPLCRDRRLSLGDQSSTTEPCEPSNNQPRVQDTRPGKADIQGLDLPVSFLPLTPITLRSFSAHCLECFR